MAEAVKVIVRCRPVNQREKDLKCKVIVQVDQAYGQCSIVNPSDQNAPAKTFTFDGAYYVDSSTEQIYNEIVFPLVECVTEGYNGTVFAYGQTGCGKSFTMQGVSKPATQRGIIPRAFEHIFEAIAIAENTKFLVHASYLEIYNEDIRDLLGKDIKKRLELKEHNDSGVYVAGLSMHPVNDVRSCEQLMEQGWKNRSVGATLMNADSSRSHSIFTIYVERMGDYRDENNNIRKGKLNLVDLAGSERQAKTGATGDRLKEATKINLSLSALGNVISALVDGKSKHIPYRDSKLTRLLQDSLGGNTKTLMVACLSPADNNYDETLSTLRYANRAKNIKNKPKINEDPKDALLRQYQEEIKKLKSLVTGQTKIEEKTVIAHDDNEIEKIKQEYDRRMQELVVKYKEEQESNAKLKDDMMKLKSNLDQQLSSYSNKVEGENGTANSIAQTNTAAPNTTPDPLYANGEDIAQVQAQAMERLKELQQNMVGGEKANDSELKAKRAKRKNIAEKKISAISDALSKLDDDDQLLLKAYGDITEELRAKTMLLKKAKKKIHSLESEINDLQSEFETDRTDYLEAIRRQDQQIKLLSQILDKVGPCMRRDCNYANIDRIKLESVWDEDLQKWRLPELVVSRTKLPPPPGGALCLPGGRETAMSSFHHPSSPNKLLSSYINGMPQNDSNADPHEDRLFQKLEKGEQARIAENYFKPKRRDTLLSNVNNVNKVQSIVNTTLHHLHNHLDTLQSKNGHKNDIAPLHLNGINKLQAFNNGTNKETNNNENNENNATITSKSGKKEQQQISSFMWKIKRNPPAYFFGTIHVPYTRVWDAIPSRVKQTFQTSDCVYFELDLMDPYTVSTLAKCQLLPKGAKLIDIIPLDMYLRLKTHLDYIKEMIPHWMSAAQRGRGSLYAEYLFNAIIGNWERKRPVWVMLMVNSLTESDIKSRGVPVLDLFLAQEAQRLNKETGSVEKVEEQCKPLNGLNATQVLFALNQTLKQHENIRHGRLRATMTTDDLIRHYNCGDLNAIVFRQETVQIPQLLNNSFPEKSRDYELARQIDEYFRTELIVNRNKRMGQRVLELLNSQPDQSFFFAFGAGHFLGNNSVLDFVKDEGFEVTQVTDATRPKSHKVRCRAHVIHQKKPSHNYHKPLASTKQSNNVRYAVSDSEHIVAQQKQDQASTSESTGYNNNHNGADGHNNNNRNNADNGASAKLRAESPFFIRSSSASFATSSPESSMSTASHKPSTSLVSSSTKKRKFNDLWVRLETIATTTLPILIPREELSKEGESVKTYLPLWSRATSNSPPPTCHSMLVHIMLLCHFCTLLISI